jgi:hypothetical protein
MMLAVVLLQPSACSDASDPDGNEGGSGKGGVVGASGSGGAQSTGGSVAGGGTTGVPKAGAPAGGANSGTAGSGGAAGAGGTSAGGNGTAGASAGTGGNGGATGGMSGGGSGGAKGGAAGSGGVGGGGVGGGGTGGSGGGSVTDPFEILGKLRPSGSAGNDYDDWMEGEIGTPVVASTAVADGNIKAPILVPAGVVYDGKGQTIKPSIEGCSGSQTESQPPVFILVPGAGLKNVTISPPACDGVHMMGNNTLENVVWTDVGEDAASVRSYFPGGKISIKGGSLKSADDKAFQFNAPVQVTITDLVASNISKLVRQNGGEDFPMTVHLSNVKVSDCGEAVVRGGPNCELTHENVTADCPLWEDD